MSLVFFSVGVVLSAMAHVASLTEEDYALLGWDSSKIRKIRFVCVTGALCCLVALLFV